MRSGRRPPGAGARARGAGRGFKRCCAILCLAQCLLTFRTVAQERAGPWIPLGSRLDREVRWAIEAGALRLNPLVRPFRLASVRVAVAAADSAPLAPQAARSLDRLHRRLALVEDSVALVAELAAQAYTSARRESFRAGGASGTAPAVAVWASYASGPMVVVVNPALDERLRDDPEFRGEKTTEVTGRMQAAYVALTGRRGDVMIGRMARNWGPTLFDGLLLSALPYAFDAVSASLRLGPFELTSLAQRLSSVRDTAASPVDFNRYFFAHRLDIRLGDNAWLGLVESGVYGGRGQGVELALHAPLNLALASQFNDSIEVNSTLGADLAVRLFGGLRLELSGFLDDIQTDRSALTDQRPASYGATAVARVALPTLPIHAAIGYTRITALTYRNSFDPLFQYSHQGVGLGRNFSDYDQLLMRLTAQPADGWTIGADLTYFRQGSGDFRQPFPADSVLALPGQGFLVAPVVRFAAGRLMVDGALGRGVEVSSELGFTRGLNGRTKTIGALSVRLSADVLNRRLGGGYPGLEHGVGRDRP